MPHREMDEAWVTRALSDQEALQAIALAMSLKQVRTTRRAWILISEGVTKNMKSLLLQVFHGIVKISTEELDAAGLTGVDLDWVSKLWSWKLTQYDKCIFLLSNSLLKKNCDELFVHKGISVARKSGAGTGGQCGSSLFVFEPSFRTFQELLNHTGKKENGKLNGEDLLNEWFQNNSSVIDDITSISTFDDLSELEWHEFYSEWIHPFMMKQRKESVQQYIKEIMNTDVNRNSKYFPSNLELTDNQADFRDTIAVIGMSCRLPGANSPDEFWKLLAEGREAIRKFPLDRPFVGLAEAREMQAGFLTCPIDEFDAKFFGISPREAALMDPQQRLLLEVTWECLENSGINPQALRDSDTGVFVGMWQQDYERIILESKRADDDKGATDFLHVFLGNKFSATASRLSFCLGLNGPAMAIESGCSSSLTGLHLACESLQKAETSLALVSGVNLVLLPFNPFSGTAADENGVVLARDYKCKTFDESADGFVRAEACGVVALKRFADARKDGENILAVIRGTAVNNDGAGTSFGTPNEKAQEKVYRAALKRANLAPADISFVEAHGTGTVVGDPIEMYAVGQAYSEGRKEPLLVGSVKTNIGHCESAAGIASLIKVILCLQHEAIPAHLNLKNLNPRIDLTSIPARIPLELTPWTATRKIAAISSFSMSATNAHVIIQQPPKPRLTADAGATKEEMVTLSAKSEEALTALVQKYIEFFKLNPGTDLRDIAYSANIGRAHLQHRIAVAATDTAQLLSRLEKQNFTQGKAPTLKSRLAFLFTGQGSQFPGMCKGLYDVFPAFREAMDRCSVLFEKQTHQTLRNVVWDDDNLLNQTLYCQPAIFCIEYCLSRLWNFFGVKPDYVLGHSVGEFGACVCAGILTLEDAMKLVVGRSQLVNGLPGGSMMAIRASLEAVRLLLKQSMKSEAGAEPCIDIAAINSPEEVVVSGTFCSIQLFEKHCADNGVKVVSIPAAHAFHSKAMDPILPDFAKIAESLAIGKPTCSYVSGTLAKVMETIEFGSQYWQRHLRDTVRFSEAVKLVGSECKILLEVGPQPILLSLAMANLEDSTGNSASFCPSQRRNEDASTAFLTAMRKLYVAGVDFDWAGVYGIRQKRVFLPLYPFQRQKYWIVQDLSSEGETSPLLHPLLGRQFLSPLPDIVFCQALRLKELDYLEDHKVAEYVVVPAAALLETFMAASREVLQGGSQNRFCITVENMSIEAALPLDTKCQIQTLVHCEKPNSSDDGVKFKLSINRKLEQHFDKWKRHATAEFTPSSKLADIEPLDVAALKLRLSHKPSLESTYKAIADAGIKFGPKFQSICSVWIGTQDLLVEVHTPENSEDYICHPIVLDAMIQTLGVGNHLRRNVDSGDEKAALSLPVGIRKFSWLSRLPSKILYAHSSAQTSGNVSLYTSNGEPLALLEGLELLQTSVNAVVRSIRADSSEIPDFMCDKWRPVVTSTCSRVDITEMICPTVDSPKVANNKDRLDDFKPKELVEMVDLTNIAAFHSFVRAIQDCGWPWPSAGQTLHVEDWKPMLPATLNPKMLTIYLYELEVRGYLTPTTEENTYRVLKALPSPLECHSKIEVIRSHRYATVMNVEYNFTNRYGACLPLILQGKMHPLRFVFPEEEAEYGAQYYYTQSRSYAHLNILMSAYLEEAVRKYEGRPSKSGILRILEVGAGSGSTAIACINTLKELSIPFHYTFTDISPIFLSEAKKTLGQGPELTYQLFNIETDPLAQGFSPDQFDVVLGAQVVHAVANVDQALLNLKRVLRPGGVLILGEGFKPHAGHTIIFGMLEGWWRYNDFRLNSKTTALLSEEQWAECLERTGFDNVSSVPGVLLGVVAARNAAQHKNFCKRVGVGTSPDMRNTWLVVDDGSQVGLSVVASLQSYDRVVVPNKTGCDYSSFFGTERVEGVLYLCTQFTSDNVVEIQDGLVSGLLSLFKSYELMAEKIKLKSRVIIVTRGVYAIDDSEPGNPNGATAWGMAKAFRSENPNFQFSIIDLDSSPSRYEAAQVFEQLWNSSEELFWAFRQDKAYVLRWTSMSKPVLPIQLPNTDRFKLINPESGAFGDIEVGPVAKQEVDDEANVEIEVRAVAMNFRDLFMVLKPEGFSLPVGSRLSSMQSVGLDVSGVVASVGTSVTKFKVGDEVFGFAIDGAFGSNCLVSDKLLMKMPQYMTFGEAATFPCAFLTAIMSLVQLAKIVETDRVLIHVASGGVGLAAIQVVRTVGAQIFATAGNRRKRAYLRSLGLQHVYASRDTSYGEGIERDTQGQGVSVVLNSLTGPNFKETTLQVCSQGARWLEIAKINIWKAEEVAALRPDVKYMVVDLSTKEEKDGVHTFRVDTGLVERIEELVANGTYQGLPRITFPLAQVREAFYYFQKAKHIGKIVVQIPRYSLSVSSGRFEHKHQLFNDRSTYLITGGLGGLGMEVCGWMRSMGARVIALVGRSLPKAGVQHLIDAWNQDGSNVVVVQADIGDYTGCQKALEILEHLAHPPLRGIIHSAGVLSDNFLIKQTSESIKCVQKPKVFGGWYLHELTLSCGLEFFVMFSSLSGILGMPGQCNHAAANRYLDALAHYRVSLGLPGTSINWGGWSEIGAAAQIGVSTEVLAGLRMFTPAQGIAALNKIMTSNEIQVGVSEPSDWSVVKSLFPQGRYLDEMKSAALDMNKFEQYDYMIEEIKSSCSPQDRQLKIQSYLEVIVKETLALPPTDVLDIDQDFSELGVDSLMGMEMKNRFQAIVGDRTLSIAAMQDNRTIRSLSAHLASLMSEEPLDTRPLAELIAEDVVLPPQVQPAELPPTHHSKYKHVLLTGGTGHLGIHCLYELLNSRPGITVHCLVRGKSGVDVEERMRKALSRHAVTPENLGNIQLILADVSKEHLGLSLDVYEKLALEIDAIFHCAAKVNHLDNYSDGSRHDMRTHNVKGAVNVLKFASSHKTKPVLYASSIFAATRTTETGLLVEDYAEKGDVGERIAWGYPLSKFIAEKLFGEALNRGIPVTTIRFPVLFASKDTSYMPTGYNHVWATILASIRVRMIPTGQLNGIPIIGVDDAAKVATMLFLSETAENGMYNLTVDSTITEELVNQALKEELGLSCEYVSYKEWRDAVFEDQDTTVMAPLATLYNKDEEQGSAFDNLHSLARETDRINISQFSSKMTKNLPGIASFVVSPEMVVRRQLRAHFQAGNISTNNI